MYLPVDRVLGLACLAGYCLHLWQHPYGQVQRSSQPQGASRILLIVLGSRSLVAVSVCQPALGSHDQVDSLGHVEPTCIDHEVIQC